MGSEGAGVPVLTFAGKGIRGRHVLYPYPLEKWSVEELSKGSSV